MPRVGMAPSDERLHRGDLAGDEVDNRLVVEDELLLVHRALELTAQLAPVHDVALHAGCEEHVAVAPRPLRGVHRDVRLTHQARRRYRQYCLQLRCRARREP